MEDINDIWNKIQKGINEAARRKMGKEEIPQRSSWFDEECLEDKKKVYNTVINRNTRQNKQEHKDEKDAHKILCRHKKRVLSKSQFDQMEIAYKQRNCIKN